MTPPLGEDDNALVRRGGVGNQYADIRADGYSRVHNGDVQGNVYNTTNIHGRSDEHQEKAWRAELLEWLAFAEMSSRQAQVADAHLHEDTFKWIFEEGHRTGFTEWLRTRQGIYWIQGKPASGKSTLMNFIMHHPQLRALSAEWTGGKQLLIPSFWLWAAGSSLQKSRIGLYRALLYQILVKEPEMCRIAFPDWHTKFKNEEPELNSLAFAMSNVVRNDLISISYLFIIDGLDEYSIDSIENDRLAEILLDMAKYPNIKLLLSSRPETPFATAFRMCPTLCMEHLTHSDIEALIYDRLWLKNPVRDLTELETNEMHGIAQVLLQRAQGVFLWVVLIVNIVRAYLINGDSFTVIQARIDELPQELESVFDHILRKRTSPVHRVEAYRYLLLALEWNSQGSLPLDSIILAIGQHVCDDAEAPQVANFSITKIKSYERTAPMLLRSRCHGLLEVTHGNVTFLHRTLHHYLREQQRNWEAGQTTFLSDVGPHFNAQVGLMAGISVFSRYRAFGWNAQTITLSLVRDHVKLMLKLNAQVEKSTSRHRAELLTTFDLNMAKTFQNAAWANSAIHWIDDLFEHPFNFSGSLLAHAVLHGSSLCLRNAIQTGGGTLSHEELQALLLYAVPSPELYVHAHPDRDEQEIAIFNIDAADLLLRCGADPLYGADGKNTWQNAIAWIWDYGLSFRWCSFSDVLDLMKLLARHKSDRARFFFIEFQGANASQAIRSRLTTQECCIQPLTTCSCAKAQRCKLLAQEVLQTIESSRESWI